MHTPTLISYSLRRGAGALGEYRVHVGYVGSHGYHEIVSLDDNEPTPTICPVVAMPRRLSEQFPCAAGGEPQFPPAAITFRRERRQRTPRWGPRGPGFPSGQHL